MCTHLGGSARARGSAVDNCQLAAWTRSGPVDFGASLTQYCCYFRTCCLALSVPRGLQELPTFVPPFAMCQRWCWSCVSSESCLCFYSAFLSMGRRAEVDWGMGGYAATLSRNLSSLSRIAFSMPQAPSGSISRL